MSLLLEAPQGLVKSACSMIKPDDQMGLPQAAHPVGENKEDND